MARHKGYESTARTVEIMKSVALTYGREETPTSLAKKWGVSKSRIQAYATNLRGYGVDVAKMRRAGLFLRAIDELRKEAPQLFKQEKRKVGRPAKKS